MVRLCCRALRGDEAREDGNNDEEHRDSRRAMIRKRAIAIATVLFVALVAPGHVTGNDSLGEQAGALLDRVVEHYQNGELEAAWEAYRAFFDHPENRNVDVDAFGRCFYQQKCPALGPLAFILGKSEAEAGNFRSFCPDWGNHGIGDLDADKLGEPEQTMRKFRDSALDGSCAEWVTSNAAWFQPRPATRRASQVLSLVPASPDDHRPFAEVAILGRRAKALIDTGATLSSVNIRLAEQVLEKVEIVQVIQVNTLRKRRPKVLARVNQIQLGDEEFSRPIVVINDMRREDSGRAAPAEWGHLIGMNLLLQYDKVCIDWDGSKLYLGDLGPCEGGTAPTRQWLTGSLGLGVHAKISSIDYVRAGIDTGSTITHCSQWFMEQNAEREAFSFGNNRAVTGECTYDPEIWFNNQERGAESPSKHIILGMDTLSQFAAFGWQLNPLKVYFAPRSLDSLQSESRNPEQETSDRQDDSPNQQ